MSLDRESGLDLAAVLGREILPTLFPGEAEGRPSFVLVADPFPGGSRATGRIVGQHDGPMAVLRSDDLAGFYPHILASRSSPSGAEQVARAVADWLTGSLRYARENRRSVLLEGSFPRPDAALAVARRYANAGFETHVVLVAARRSDVLLAALSQRLSPGFSIAANSGGGPIDVDLESIMQLVAAVPAEPAVGRLTVVGRRGDIVFDQLRSEADPPYAEAAAAYSTAVGERLTVLESVQWLSELRRLTVRVSDSPAAAPSHEIVRALVELHEAALREVVPQLPIPAGSETVRVQERRHAEDLVALRRLLSRPSATPAAEPAIGVPGPAARGPSR